MFRTLIIQSATTTRAACRSRSAALSRPTFQSVMRYSTTDPQDARKAALNARDEMQKDWDAKVLTYEELKPKVLEPSTDKYLIDVREPGEVQLGSIPSSVNLPLSVLSGALHLDPATFKQQYGFDKPTKDQEIVFYCRSGKRSSTACDVAKRNGFTNILNYKGSWLEWAEKEGIKTS